MVAKRSHQSPIRIKQVGKVSPFALAVSAAPEKHWFRHVSQFLTVSVLAACGPNPPWLTFRAIARLAVAAAPDVYQHLYQQLLPLGRGNNSRRAHFNPGGVS
jgi:hypothetical protein